MRCMSHHRSWVLVAGTALMLISTAIAMDAQPKERLDPAIARKVARIELARSIRAFAASTLANGECLVERGRLSQQQANQAMPMALEEMGISAAVLNNPQVRKAAQMLKSHLDADCGLSALDEEKARKLVADEL